jgi:hypothetical protein
MTSSVAYRGDCTLSEINGELHVRHADPQILISTELLWRVAMGECHPAVSMSWQVDRVHHKQLLDFTACVLTIRAVNQTVVYRIADRAEWDQAHPDDPSLFLLDVWPAEWPD